MKPMVSRRAAVLLSLAVQAVLGQITLGSFPAVVSVGETYALNWSATGNWTYNIWLVRDESAHDAYSWTRVLVLASGLDFNTLNPSFSWTVPNNISVNDRYAFWFNAGTIPFNGATTSATSNAFTLTTSKPPASTTSASPTTSTNPIAGTSRPESGGSSGDHGGRISGGAIAGIVIGCILAIALVAGAILLFRRRRGRSTVESRQAEARAARLEPVMHEGYPSYEMNRPTSKV